jgi:hypothetical protein
MSLIQNTQLGAGGAGFQGSGPDSAVAILTELQGLNVSLLAGALANTKIDLAAIRTEDTIIAALNNNAGTITDIANTLSIVDVRATGTITVGTATAGDTFSVAGLTYTLVLANATVLPTEVNKVKLGADADGTAANIAAAINLRESARTEQKVSASAATNVVTITAVAEGTGGNAIALAETGSSVVVSGATLSGGTATGGIKSSGATAQVILFWFNKQ